MDNYPLLPRQSLIFCLALTLSAAASADTLFGIYAGAGTWSQEFSGDLRSGITDIDVDDDLGLDDEMNNMFYVAVEHPLPFIPNVRANYSDVGVSGDNVLSRTVEFAGQVFPVDTAISTDVDVTQGDAILYYEFLDNWVSLDLGLGARYMDGSVSIQSTADFSEADFTVVVPMLYGRVRGDLPFTGFWVGAEAMGVGYSDTNLIDANAQIGYESPLRVGAEIGWRILHADLNDFDDIDEASIDVSGPYFALNVHF